MTEVSDSSIFSRYGFWSVNASPVSTSANLSSRSPMSDMPSHLLDRVRRPYRHLRVPRHARPHGGSSRRSPSERPRASVESEQWRQAHRANPSCSIEKRRRFTGPGLRPLRTTSRRAARDHDFRTNPAFPADGSNRGGLHRDDVVARRVTDEYFAQPAPDPGQFGMPTEDDGSRDDPLLSDRSWAVSSYRPDVHALAAAPTRVVIAVGEESEGTFTGRTAVATAELLGQQATVFPSHHGGFMGGEFGYAGQP